MKIYGGVEGYLHALSSALDRGKWSASRPRPLFSREKITGKKAVRVLICIPTGNRHPDSSEREIPVLAWRNWREREKLEARYFLT
jgi:hypothetical protein